MKTSVLILNAGANLRNAYYTGGEAVYFELPVRELAWRDLRRYDVLVIPAWSDQDLLSEHAEKLTHFIYRGGVLLQFGCHSVRWFKFLDWVLEANPSVAPTAAGASLFSNVDFTFLQWHTEFVAHGYFLAKHRDAKVLAVDGANHPVAVAVKHGSGIALFMTLDPDFHFVTGSFVCKDSDKRRTQAMVLLQGAMRWAMDEFSSRHSYTAKFIRRLRGVISFVNLAPVLNLALFLVLGALTFLAIYTDNAARSSPTTIWSTIASVAGLLVSLGQLVRRRRVSGSRT